MIAELTAAMTAIRETAQIAKLMNEAKTQAEVNAAIGELNSKLASIQRECVSLVELVGSYQEINASLKAKIAEFENFEAQTEGYILNQLESGTHSLSGTAARAGAHAHTVGIGAHTHSVAIGSHGHTITVNAAGNAENTVKNIAFNYIVRLA